MENQLGKRLTAALTGLLVITVFFGGCGASSKGTGSNVDEVGSGKKEGDGAPVLTKAEFLKQGDEICRKTVEGMVPAIRAFLSKNGVTATEQLSQTQEEELISVILLPRLRVSVEEFRKLGLPTGEEREAEEVITGFEEGAAGFDPSEPNRFDYVDKRAQAFGFKVCGKD
jgi:hypothetical protein